MDKIGNLIKTYTKSPEYINGLKLMELGSDYYSQKNTLINNREKKFYTGKGHSQKDPYKANHKIASGFMKLLTKQKVNYSINNRLSLASDEAEVIENDLSKSYRNMLKKVGIEASKKGVAYLQVYIENNEFKYKKIPSEQIIAIPCKDNKDAIECVIRIYKETGTNSNGEIVELQKAEFWTNEVVYYYELNEKDSREWEISNIPHNPKPHITQSLKYGNITAKVKAHSWGKPPFCVLYNNDERSSDLQPIKQLIDVFDIVNSDFANNLEDFQDVYWILKNYGGEDFDSVMEEIKQHKVIATGEDGDARTETVSIPVEARNVMLELTEKLIYKFGMGVNMASMTANITNVQILALYNNLDLKANDFETELEEFWQQLMYFLNRYYELTGKIQAESSLTFNRAITLNENEKLEANANQIGAISERTRLANHPWVKNVDDEIEQMAKESGTIRIDDIE